MADVKISALPTETTAGSGDLIPVDAGGTTKAITVANLFTAPVFGSYSDSTAVSDPSAPGASTLREYAQTVCGRPVPRVIGPAGAARNLQSALYSANHIIWYPSGATAGTWLGDAAAQNGTFANVAIATTNKYTTIKRSSYKNVVTTTNQSVGQASSNNVFFISSTAGIGGFFFFCRFGLEAWTAGNRMFVGLCTNATPLAAEPDTLLNACGFIIDAADTAWHFFSANGSTGTETTISGQTALAANLGYDVYMYVAAGGGTLYFRMDEIVAGTTLIDSSTTTTLPANNVTMRPVAMAGNAANTSAGAAGIGINKIYVESDY